MDDLEMDMPEWVEDDGGAGGNRGLGHVPNCVAEI